MLRLMKMIFKEMMKHPAAVTFSASAGDIATKLCFFALQHTNFPPTTRWDSLGLAWYLAQRHVENWIFGLLAIRYISDPIMFLNKVSFTETPDSARPNDKSSESATYDFASCVSSPKTNDSFPTVDVKIFPKSDVKDPSLTNGFPSCSFKENVKPPRNLCNKSGIADRIPCKNNFVRTKTCFVCGSKSHLIKDCDVYDNVDNFPSVALKAASVPAGSRNSSAFISAGRSIHADSRNRLASIHAGRHIPAGRFNKPAPFLAGRSVPTGWTNHAARPFFKPTNLYFDNVSWPKTYDYMSMNEGRWGSAVKPSAAPHQDQSSFNQNYFQQPMPNPEDIIDPTTAMNMALALMAKACKLNYSTPTNNNQRISSNPKNRQIAQPGMNIGQDRQMQKVVVRAERNAAGQNGNQIRCYNCRGVGHYARNCTARPRKTDATYLQIQLLIAQKEEAGIQLQTEEYDLMAAAADLDEIEEVNANCILMANLQQASTSGTQTDSAPVYDTDGSAEVHENYDDNEIFNMFTQEVQYTELLEPIPESHQVPQNDNNVISEDTSV
nr:hypothetical protein [Tanacetum cinerariifolium]